jgi:predicted ATPase with chaperone activity
MLAHSLTTILPAMTLAEALETTRLHRVVGRTGGCTALTVANLDQAPPGPRRRYRPERGPSGKTRHPALGAASWLSRARAGSGGGQL